MNLPYSAAKTIFENVDAGYAVLVYELPGTEQAPDPNQQAADKVITSINNIGNVTWNGRAISEACGQITMP